MPNNPADRAHTNAYRTLFRRVLLYNNLAAEADAENAPKPYLRGVVAGRFALTDTENDSLQWLAIAYQIETGPLQKRAIAVRMAFRARFPDLTWRKGSDTSPPQELAELQRQEDAITIRYCALFRNTMAESEFERIDAKVLATFGASAK